VSWPLARLGDVAPAKPVKHAFSETEGVWTLNLDQVEAETGKVFKKVVMPLSSAGSSTHGFDERHVLYSKLRPYLNKVILPDDRGLATTELVPMLPDAERLNREYLAYYLRSKSFVDWVSAQVAGAKMPRVSMKLFWDHKIPLPSLSEQNRIAKILEKADVICQKRQQAIQLVDELIRAVFLDMFGGPEANMRGWAVKPLDEYLTFLTSGSRGWAKYYSETGSKFIRIQNVSKNKLLLSDMAFVNAPQGAEANRTKVQVGDVLLSITADLGRSSVVTKDIAGGHINQHLALLRLSNERLNPRYLSAYLSSTAGINQFMKKNKSAVKAGLNFTDIKTLEVPVPPIAEQLSYEKTYDKAISLQVEQFRSLEEAKKSFGALSQKAFTGKL